LLFLNGIAQTREVSAVTGKIATLSAPEQVDLYESPLITMDQSRSIQVEDFWRWMHVDSIGTT
jgi:hypothetical protein